MLAACEICRIVQLDPTKTENAPNAIVMETRTPIEGEFFSYCPLCERFQIFIEVKSGR